jgi:hypothetical protein
MASSRRKKRRENYPMHAQLREFVSTNLSGFVQLVVGQLDLLKGDDLLS